MRCSDPVWAEELELMQEQLLERLREHLGEQRSAKLCGFVRETFVD